MQKGILLEVEGKTGIVLTPAGEFRRVPLPDGEAAVGDEILLPEAETGTGLRWARLWVAAAAVVLAILAPVGYWQWSLAQPAALVMIDINPSVQLTVSGRRQVVDAVGLNADGREVLARVEWRRRPVEEVARAIASQAILLGKLNPAADDSAVVVAVAPVGGKAPDPSLAQAIVERSRAALQSVVAQEAESRGVSPEAGIAVVQATAEEVEEARRQELTVPKLIILEEVRAEHPEVTADAIREVPPGQFLKSLGIDPDEVLRRAEQRRSQVEPAAKPAAKGDAAGRGEDAGPAGQPRADKGGPGKDSPGKGNPGKSHPGKGNSAKGSSGSPWDNGEQWRTGGDGDRRESGPSTPWSQPGTGRDTAGRSSDDDRRGGDRDRKDQGSPDKPGKGNAGRGADGVSGRPSDDRRGESRDGPGSGNRSGPGGGAGRGGDRDDGGDDDDDGDRGRSGRGSQGSPGSGRSGREKGDDGDGRGRDRDRPGPDDRGSAGKGSPGRGDDDRRGDRDRPGQGGRGNPR